MNRLSSNLHKLRALHQQERSRGLFAAISYDSVLVEKPITSVQTTNCLGSVIIPLQSGELLQKAKEFCRQTRVVANKCKVFVGNVSYRVKSRKLKEFFKNFGEVIYAEIITDYKTKRSRGFGFVTFSNEWEAERAKNSSDEKRTLEGRVMAVCSAERKKRGLFVKEALEFYAKNDESRETDGVMEDDSCSSDTKQYSEPPIFRLNEDAILHIFLHLSAKDRIRIERVCRKWRVLAIKSWRHTTHLDFQGAFASFRGVGAKQCKSLEELKISGVEMSTSSLKVLAKGCSNLEKITLQGCYKVGEKALWWLFKDCKKLTYINLQGNRSLKGQCFFMLSPVCVDLYLKECNQLTDKGINHIGSNCKNLKNIDISECRTLTDEGILTLTQRELDLSNNYVVDDSVLYSIGRNCIHLISLNVESCQVGVTNAGLHSLVSCYQLSSLSISYVSKITDEGIIQLAACGSLERVVARGCTGLADMSIESLLKHCRNLTVLDVSGCSGITNCSLELFTLYYGRGDRPFLTCTLGGTAVEENEILRVQPTLYQCQLLCSDFSIPERTEAVPSYGSGKTDVIFTGGEGRDEGAFYCEGNEDDDDEFDDFADDEEDDDDKHLLNVLDDEEVWMAEDSLWWRPDDAVDFLEADYPSLLAEQLHRS
ncbi:putative RNA-binding protein EEED8.10 [Acropora cervicornis]|uniref:RNA-binding protein EEED8.10 n=1 Tax=Acropora cervicornis TaxID=6130 RepID=A0AAD9R6T8_ACRCE|nr:putative RNA-binding protein EEED8.10 [Acropora cervicornis]